MPINLMYTILWWSGYLSFILAIILLYPIIGIILIQTKLVAFPGVKNVWQRAFHVLVNDTFSESPESVSGIGPPLAEQKHVDLRVYNLSIAAEVILKLESAPQIIIQLINNQGGEWSTVAIVCLFLVGHRALRLLVCLVALCRRRSMAQRAHTSRNGTSARKRARLSLCAHHDQEKAIATHAPQIELVKPRTS